MTISQNDDDDSFTNDDRRMSLIDFSSADDSLIANPFHHHSSELFSTSNSRDEFDDAATKFKEWERESQPNEIDENNKFNLRQSIAWDTAFFTSPGVLDPDELSCMIEGVEKGDKHTSSLPAIQEEVSGSCESISTLKSDNSLTQESLEDVDLFQDVRASIQNFGRMSDLARANRNVLSRFQIGDSSKEVGMASCKKAPSSKSPSASMQGTGKLTKKNPISPHLSQKPVARREEPCISKQRKTLGKSSPSSTISSNRSSLGDFHVKSEKDKANKNNCGKVNSVMNTTVIKGSQVNGLQPITSSKSPLGLSVATKTKSTISPSSSSNLSSNISKSPLNSLKRKVDAGTKKSPSSCSVVRTPPRIASRDKIGSSNSSLSGLVSATKFSSSVSPANSISDWSSESSSSTSMTKFRSKSSRTTFHSSSSRMHIPKKGATHVSNSQKSQSGSCLEGKESRNAGSIGQCVMATAKGMVLTPSPKKPLGLRQPSPKIGFFDRGKSSIRSPCERMQPHTVAPQGRVSPSEAQNKARLGKLQSPRSIIPTESKELINRQDLHPVPLNKSSDVKTSMALPCVKSSAVAPMEVQNLMHLKAGVGNLDANSTMVEGHIRGVQDLNLGFTQGNSQYDDQVDCLSRQVELMDINLKTQT
ncbi:uncharacterized protein [Medicago truncatula]|uniref:Uncharacterized protein n=1 Tax=Medicago truncatula TaxID=3880 RepID=A0A072VKF5_MEDTR|nr:uncharacterized protein LOC25484044 isoform X3 [Medicago truncatula]KEH42282.1 hypothetical protein MTR_1g066870 [Medicago truncatula]